MSKRLASWLCFQFCAAGLLSFAAALAEDVKGDSSTSQANIQPATAGSSNDSVQPRPTPIPSLSSDQAVNCDSSTKQPPVQNGEAGAATGNASSPASNSNPLTEARPQALSIDQNKIEEELRSAEQHAKSEQSVQAKPAASSKRIVLYGRIEQIAAGKGAEFPIILKPMQAKLDPRAAQLKATASETALGGSVVSSFPTDYDGVWGGSLAVWAIQQSPVCWQIDPDEAKWTAAAMKPGLVGQTNFNFSRDRANKIELEPARILFAVPIKDTNQQEQVNQLLGSGALGGLGGGPGGSDFMRQLVGSMANSMTVPMVMSLGNFQTGAMQTGVSGNQLAERVVRNVIRELAPGVLEQQIITSESERIAKTGQLHAGYGESVIRITKQSANRIYVQVATVSYTQDRQFRRKIILYGTLRKGQVVDTNPDPMAQFGNMLNLPGGGRQMPQLPQMLPGQNPFENLFPH